MSYAVNERVLCYHGPLIYEAKILKTENWDETTTKSGEVGAHFLVHYKGWKQKWDEWVSASRLLKFTPENQTYAKEIRDTKVKKPSAQTATTSKDKEASGTTTTNTGARRKEATTSRKRGRDDDEDRPRKKPDMKLDVPEVLKMFLVDDWEAVTKNNQLVSIPREPNVLQILTEFGQHLENMEKKLPSFDIIYPTLISGLQLYFERSLGTNLLYRFERQQYADVKHRYYTGQHVVRGKEPNLAEIYGGEHLLRMLVHMPSMIAQTTMDFESVALLKDYINEFMVFMLANKERFFLSNYDNASSHYLALMRV